MNRLRLLTILVLSLALSATSIVPMSIERLTRASSDVIIGESVDSWTEWDANHTLIYTITRFRVQRAIKGQAGGEIFVRQMGGVSGGYQQKVAGVRHFRTGERSVLFLHPGQGADSGYVVTGLMQGNFAVKTAEADPIVSNGISGVESVDPRSGNVTAFRGASMRLSQLEARVKQAER
jgi:hypothetical protein